MVFLDLCKKRLLILGCLLLVFSINVDTANAEDIGVILVVHGGMIENKTQSLWDAVVHQFSYDTNHSVYQLVIWNSYFWPLVLDPSFTEWALRFLRMYEFEYERIGGIDPFHAITDQQLADMEAELDTNPYGINFEVDWAGYMAAASVENYAYPRFIYYGPDGPGVGNNVTYCGENEIYNTDLAFDAGTEAFNVSATLEGGTSLATATIDVVTVVSGDWSTNDAAGYLTISDVSGTFQDDEVIQDDGGSPGSATADGTIGWYGCDPERYNVDGPVERLLNSGASRIIVVDWTMGGPRFSKTYDVVEMTKRALDDWNAGHEIGRAHV